MAKFVRGEGPFDAKIMFIGEAPGKTEDELGRPFVGPSGAQVDDICETVGIDRSKVYVTNIRKYKPPFNNFRLFNPGEPDIEQQLAILKTEIEHVKPNVILALGDKALYYLTGKSGITKWRGSLLQSHYGPKVVATFHPANLVTIEDSNKEDEKASRIFKFAHKYTIRLDFERAKEQSLFPDLRLPERNLQICRSSLDFQRFIERSDRSKPLSVDIEASRCIPICIALSYDKSEALSIPLFNRLTHINYDGIAPQELAYIWKDLADVLYEDKIIGQNFKYDEDKIYRLGFRLNLYGDTMLLAHCLNPEFPSKSLAYLQSIYTHEPYHKDEGTDFFELKRSKKAVTLKLDQLLHYNAKDAAVTSELHEVMLAEAKERDIEDYYFNCMVPRHKFYLHMEREGFKVDEIKREALLDKYMQMYEHIHNQTTELLGYELNVSSNPQVTKCLYNHLKFPFRYKRGTANTDHPTLTADEDTLTALIANHSKTEQQKKVAQNILDERKIRKTVSTYILAKPDYDGRMRTSYNICGAETDRTSTSNIASPIRPEKSMGLGFQTLTKHGDIGADICEMFVPDDGMVFINADLSQAEARVVFVLAQEFELLKLLDDPRFDIHWKTAKHFFTDLPDVDECKKLLSKEDMRRFIGKTIRHAGHLGAGKKQAMVSVNTDAKKYGFELNISEWKAGKYMEAFHEGNPKIRSVFHKEIEEAVSSTRKLVGPRLIDPFGNRMRKGRERMFFDRWSNELVKSALSDIPQSTVSNQTKFAGIRIKRRIPDLRFILEGHDALLVQVPKSDVDLVAKIMKEEMETSIDFNGCTLDRNYLLTIPAEFGIGEKDYKNIEKYKVA